MSNHQYDAFSTLHVHISHRIAWVTLDHPPINLLDAALAQDLDDVTRLLATDSSIRVVVLRSQDPDFFIAHSGLARVAAAPPPAVRSPLSTTPSPAVNLRQTQLLTERLRTMPQATIAQVSGRARGGGNEIVLGADMCFADRDRAVFGQPEIAIGLVPGGGSTQRLPDLVGRGRAMEILLGGRDFSATEAERYGWINRALGTGELEAYVRRLAERIASYPAHAIAHVKAAVNRGVLAGVPSGLLEEARQADLAVSSEVTKRRVAEGLRLGLETREGELDVLATLDKLESA